MSSQMSNLSAFSEQSPLPMRSFRVSFKQITPSQLFLPIASYLSLVRKTFAAIIFLTSDIVFNMAKQSQYGKQESSQAETQWFD